MRMKDIANGESGRQSVGEISDHRVRQPQDERKAVRRRTFTRWMNMFLQRRDPPEEVLDLFTDFQDGRILMALLEELSGCKLLYRFRSSSQRIFRLNNISKALAFLDDRHVKLPGIDATGIADGIPSAVLELVWNMVLHFQVKTQGLQRNLSSSLISLTPSIYPSSSDLLPQPNDIGSYCGNTLPSKGRKAARGPKYHGKAIKKLLQWVQRCTSRFGVEVHDFGGCWRSGLAFLALIKSINPDLVDLTESFSKQPRENIQLAFTIAHRSLDIQPLLEPEDVSGPSLDEQSIITYVSMFLGHCSGTDQDDPTDIRVSEIPNCGSLESVSTEETHADEPNAQASVQGSEKSREQLLWKRWAQRPSGSPVNTLITTSEAMPLFSKKKSQSQSILQLPSPLDAGVLSQEIRSGMENASLDQGDSKPTVDESHFSFSSEEGIYSLSALDSDEEEAYSYILDLNKEVFPPYNELKRQVPRVEEETEEEMFMSRHQTEELKHLETWKKTSNGRRHLEDSNARLMKRGWCEREAPIGTKNSKLFDGDSQKIEVEKKTERGPLEKCGQVKKVLKFNEGHERKSGKEQVEGYKDEEKGTQQSVGNLESFNVGVKAIVGKTTYEAKGAGETSPNLEELTNEEDEEKCRDGVMVPVVAAEQKDRNLKVKRQELTSKASTVAGRTTLERDTRAGVNVHGVESYWIPGCTAAPPSSREGGFIPQSSAAPWDVTPSEQDMLLVLWILLYCYFIF
ncbi:uncharacterized protein ACO6RY_10026 [Pungitius sinensis]